MSAHECLRPQTSGSLETLDERIARITELEQRRAGRHVESRALTRESLPSVMVQGTSAGPLITHSQRARSAPPRGACVRALVDAASSLPLHVYRRTEAGRVRADETADGGAARSPRAGRRRSPRS